MYTCIYLTRRCPLRCEYCRIRDSTDIGPELNLEQWKEAFLIMKELGVEFNLILGNEILMLRDDLVELTEFFHEKDIRYAYYTTFPEPLWSEYRDKLIDVGIKNLSCGFDTLPKYSGEYEGDILKKSISGIAGLEWARDNGVPDLQGTITVSKLNLEHLPDLLMELTDRNLWAGVNVIHHSDDPMFDFFPKTEEIEDFVLTEDDRPTMERIIKEIKEKMENGQLKMQNTPGFFDAWLKHGIKLDWHCTNPLILSVDADGSMRTCGYRKGGRVKKYNIFDLASEETRWKFMYDWNADRSECPGCFWSFWFLAEQQKREDPDFADGYFQDHDSKYWDKEKGDAKYGK